MKDSIKLTSIKNRKIIIELRFEPNPSVIDRRGLFLEKLITENIILNPQWEYGIGELKYTDSLELKDNRQIVYLDLKRLSIISSKNETNESFFHFFEKVFKVFKEIIPSYTIIRIGCRIQGTYKCFDDDYSQIVKKFAAHMPSNFLLEDFTVKDLRFHLVYQNGQYQIGPINKDDNFLKNEFPYDEADNSVGFAIDTDNYIIRSKEKEKIKDTSIREVYLATLSVEKLLFEKLSIL